MRNHLISLALSSFCAGAAVLAACSAPDPGVSALGLSHTIGVGGAVAPVSQDAGSTGTTPPPTTGTGADSGSPTTGTPTGSSEGGADAGAGGGEGGATGEAVGFLGETTPWATNLPATTAAASMTNGTVPAPTLDCMSAAACHASGGTQPFLAAGFVATAAGGTTGAPDVEVRVYANGGPASAPAYSAHTDSAGYFWIQQPTGTLGPFNAGVRAGPAGTSPKLMPAAQGTATDATLDCQSSTCHGGATTGVIHI